MYPLKKWPHLVESMCCTVAIQCVVSLCIIILPSVCDTCAAVRNHSLIIVLISRWLPKILSNQGAILIFFRSLSRSRFRSNGSQRSFWLIGKSVRPVVIYEFSESFRDDPDSTFLYYTKLTITWEVCSSRCRLQIRWILPWWSWWHIPLLHHNGLAVYSL